MDKYIELMEQDLLKESIRLDGEIDDFMVEIYVAWDFHCGKFFELLKKQYRIEMSRQGCGIQSLVDRMTRRFTNFATQTFRTCVTRYV